ncbi:hypothetical protein DERP_003543 [Dermatophagoides pteronyssinus]|uniref:Uncharacterized protein n=1 Tax=Dermatophagoides pteronyssinus TaxID=6956 RepID=A0ABQ8JLN3_DERPT|nr:hypothetical protein DERP_003543 [Dermatophagoides pteronyssinus]
MISIGIFPIRQLKRPPSVGTRIICNKSIHIDPGTFLANNGPIKQKKINNNNPDDHHDVETNEQQTNQPTNQRRQ